MLAAQVLGNVAEPRFFRPDILENAARWSEAYAGAGAFPHIVIDGFLEQREYRLLSDSFPAPNEDIWHQYRSGRENRKLQSQTFDGLPFSHRLAINDLNGPSFVRFLEKLTGIAPLIPDPHLTGGGLHQTLRGGHLGIHIDYNRHREWKLARKLNVILYLNDEWHEEWGGHLELWDRGNERCVERIAPVGNRLVVFSTSDESWHGHPEPLACPEGVTRRSIALYYYGTDQVGGDHGTIFRERPGERFKVTPRERLTLMKRALT